MSLAQRRLRLESIRAPLPCGRSRSSRRRLVSNLGHLGGLRLFDDRRSLFAFVGPRSLLMRARYSHEASPCPRRARRLAANDRVTLRWGQDPNIQLLPYVFRRTGTPAGALDPPPREACSLCPRSTTLTRLAPSHRARLGLHDSPNEEPCPLRRSPATDLSVVALAKLAFTL
jgi:hypothetical protein